MTASRTLPVELVPIGQLSEHPENYNRGDDERLAELLERYGQWRPAVVQRSTGRVLIGNTMLRAARDRLGWAELSVTYRDVDDDEARRILAADNRARDFSSRDDRALLTLLRQIGGDDGDLSGTLWDTDDFDDLRAVIEEQDAALPGDDDAPYAGQPGSAYGAGGSADGSNVRRTPSYSEYEQAYADRATRFLALVYPVGQYPWMVAQLGKLAAELGVDTHAEVVLRLVADRCGEEPPAEDTEPTAEQVTAADVAAEEAQPR